MSPSRVMRGLAVTAALLLVASLAGQLSKYLLGHDYVKGLVPLFDVNEEGNVPTLFSVVLLVACAQLLLTCAYLANRRRDAHVAKWVVLSGGFVWMAADEAWAFHERLVGPVAAMLGPHPPGVLLLAWVVPVVLMLPLLGMYFLRFLLDLPPASRKSFLVAAAVYLFGAVGMEMAGSAYYARHGWSNLPYSLLAHLEEGCEMAGLILFIGALLAHLVRHEGLRVHVDPGAEPERSMAFPDQL